MTCKAVRSLLNSLLTGLFSTWVQALEILTGCYILVQVIVTVLWNLIVKKKILFDDMIEVVKQFTIE